MRNRKIAPLIVATIVALALLSGCASSPPPPASGLGTLWGTLELAPAEGISAPTPGGGSYGDPRMRDVRRVDHQHVGFSVVYLSDRPAPADRQEIEIRSTRTGVRLSPESGALGVNGSIEVKNLTEHAHVVSVPSLAILGQIEPGGALTLDSLESGETAIHLLSEQPSECLLFVSPGPFARCNAQGGWILANQSPGPAQLHAWHHRFPPAMQEVHIAEDTTTQVLLRSFVSSPAHTSTVTP